MVTPCLTTACPGSVSSQLPPCSAAMSTMTLPGFMLLTISAVMSFGAGLPRIRAVVMMMSASWACLAYISRLGLLEALAHHLGVAATPGAFFRVVDLDELATQRFDLVGDLGPRVVGHEKPDRNVPAFIKRAKAQAGQTVICVGRRGRASASRGGAVPAPGGTRGRARSVQRERRGPCPTWWQAVST